MFQIDPLDLLRKLKEKDQDDFEEVAMVIADYIQEAPGNEEVYKEILNLICEPPIKAPYLSLVVNK